MRPSPALVDRMSKAIKLLIAPELFPSLKALTRIICVISPIKYVRQYFHLIQL